MRRWYPRQQPIRAMSVLNRMKAAIVVVVVGSLVSIAHADPKPTHCGADVAPFAVKLAAKPDKYEPVLALDGELKKYFAITFPTGLDFDPGNKVVLQRATKRFNDWYAAKSQAAEQLSTKYAAILGMATNEQKIEVAARLGQVTDELAHELATAEIPGNVRRGEFAVEASKAFCEALTDKAEPLFTAAAEKYRVCADTAKQQSISNDWTAWCDARLAILAPAKP